MNMHFYNILLILSQTFRKIRTDRLHKYNPKKFKQADFLDSVIEIILTRTLKKKKKKKKSVANNNNVAIVTIF